MEPPDVDYGYCDGYGADGSADSSSELDYALEDDVSEYHGHLSRADFEAYQEADGEEFQKMWPTVEEMCRSIMNTPLDWVQDKYTITHKPSKMIYWTGTGDWEITESYIGGNSKRVFSDKQGKLIRAAWKDRHKNTPSAEQLAVMKSLGMAPKPFVPEPGFWGELWVAIKFLPTMARFCMRYNK